MVFYSLLGFTLLLTQLTSQMKCTSRTIRIKASNPMTLRFCHSFEKKGRACVRFSTDSHISVGESQLLLRVCYASIAPMVRKDSYALRYESHSTYHQPDSYQQMVSRYEHDASTSSDIQAYRRSLLNRGQSLATGLCHLGWRKRCLRIKPLVSLMQIDKYGESRCRSPV